MEVENKKDLSEDVNFCLAFSNNSIYIMLGVLNCELILLRGRIMFGNQL
jgi:hypothetical protein